MKAVKAKCKFERENKEKLSLYNFECLFSTSLLVFRSIFTDEYYPSGYFPRTGSIYGPIVSLRGRTPSRHVINLNQWGSEKI